MSRNKTPGADLENKRGLFFQIGLTVALAAALLVINYETPKPSMEDTTTPILGLEITRIGRYDADTSQRIAPPEAHVTNFGKKTEQKFSNTNLSH
ncbi:MAG: hypothetical protein MJZ66_01725 [Bacteroidales bacterium]|nr:hypothetical protein [Bacteroidales bacterium]